MAVRQSMNFLAGLLVLLMGEENAYWTLVRSACSLCGTAALFSSLVLNIAVTVSLPVDVQWTSCTTTRDATDAKSTAALVYMRCVNGQAVPPEAVTAVNMARAMQRVAAFGS